MCALDASRLSWAVLLLLACIHSVAPPSGSPSADKALMRFAIPNIQDVACDAANCVVLHGGQLSQLPSLAPIATLPDAPLVDSLWADAGQWWVEGPCEQGRCRHALNLSPLAVGPDQPAPPLPLAGEAPELTAYSELWIAAWNHAHALQWRTGFDRLAVSDGPAILTLLRGMEGSAQLIRTGVNAAFVRLELNAAGPIFPATLAMHPTGMEGYLLAWPSPILIAFDPLTLSRHWTLLLDAPAQGLFIDTSGRFLVVGTGEAEVDPLIQWSLPLPDPAAVADPFRDEALRAPGRPPMSAVEVIDLSTHKSVLQVHGQWRRWLTLPDGRVVVATDKEIAYFKP